MLCHQTKMEMKLPEARQDEVHSVANPSFGPTVHIAPQVPGLGPQVERGLLGPRKAIPEGKEGLPAEVVRIQEEQQLVTVGSHSAQKCQGQLVLEKCITSKEQLQVESPNLLIWSIRP